MPPSKPSRTTSRTTPARTRKRATSPSTVADSAHATRSDEQPGRSALLIGSEALPFSKTGGLADVLGALPSALGRLGWDVTLAVPRYRGVTAGTLAERFTMSVGGYTSNIAFFEAPLGTGARARALLVDDPLLYG